MLTISLECKDTLPRNSIVVRGLVGREAVSSLFEWELEVVAASDDDLIEQHQHALLNQPARIGFHDGARNHHVWGIIRSIESRAPERDHAPIVHHVVVVPRIWRATQDIRSQLVSNKSAVQIAREVLTTVDPGLDAEKDLDISQVDSPVLEYRVQYEEPSFDFVSRLLEDDGIGYRFAHGEDRERLTLFDRNSALPPLDEVPYVKADRPDAQRPVVTSLRRTIATAPHSITVRDYNYQLPHLRPAATVQAAVGSPARVGAAITSREPFVSDANGLRIAGLRMEERLAGLAVYRGRSSVHELHAGDRLRVRESPFGGDLDLVIVEVRHEVTFESDNERTAHGYGNEFVALDAGVAYRPPRRTPKPRIHGVTYGIIVGPDLGPAAPIDDQGRYLVSFVYAPAGTTPWVRRVQPLAGVNIGMHFPLRLGTEVAVAYVDGDPDRPVILGSVPNVLTPSPVQMSNATQSVIATSSGARIEIEDNA